MEEKKVTSHYIEHFGEDDASTFSPGITKLKSEHGPLLNQIEKLMIKIDASEIDSNKWEEIYKGHQAFTNNLEQHSEKEERLLFDLMKEHIGTAHGPIEIMEEEHEEISKNLAAFSKMAEEVAGIPSEDDLSELYLFLQQAYEVMQQHFYKEEHAIYPMAEDLLSEKEKENLEKALV